MQIVRQKRGAAVAAPLLVKSITLSSSQVPKLQDSRDTFLLILRHGTKNTPSSVCRECFPIIVVWNCGKTNRVNHSANIENITFDKRKCLIWECECMSALLLAIFLMNRRAGPGNKLRFGCLVLLLQFSSMAGCFCNSVFLFFGNSTLAVQRKVVLCFFIADDPCAV